MSRWFRFYDDAINEPKLLKLSDALFRAWVGLLCIASKNAGRFPPAEDIALMLRMKPERAGAVLADLKSAGLVDEDETGFHPHNWSARQFKSDVSNERVGRYRERQRNVTPAVTVTPSEQSQKQIQNRSEQRAIKNDGVAKERATRALRTPTPTTADPTVRKQVWEQKVQTYMVQHWSQERSQAAIAAYLEGSDLGKREFEVASAEMNAVRTDGSIPVETRVDRPPASANELLDIPPMFSGAAERLAGKATGEAA